METEIISIPLPGPEDAPLETFIAANHLNPEKRAHAKRIEDAKDVYVSLLAQLKPKAVVCRYDNISHEGDTIRIEGQELRCGAFSTLPAEAPVHAAIYFLTIGEYAEDSSLLRQLFADSWGTLLTEYARRELEKLLLARFAGCSVSPVFGPGYFGMDMDTLEKLAAIADPSEVGIRLNANYFMVPQKSCTGFYLASPEAICTPKPSCRDCIGNKMNCNYCMLHRR